MVSRKSRSSIMTLPFPPVDENSCRQGEERGRKMEQKKRKKKKEGEKRKKKGGWGWGVSFISSL